MARMVSPEGREAEIVPDGIGALMALGWELVDPEPEQQDPEPEQRKPVRKTTPRK